MKKKLFTLCCTLGLLALSTACDLMDQWCPDPAPAEPTLLDLKPEAVWKHFDAVCKVPRYSGYEDHIRAYLLDWGRERGLETLRDEGGNVLIRKPASAGRENSPGIILQTHMDMVAQKATGVVHDFTRDPIEAYVDGDWVRARGTTLGADDGIGLSVVLAVLEDNTLEHGPLEALFTYDEEYELTGAMNLSPHWLRGRVLLNLDAEEEGVFTIGAAGGQGVVGHYDCATQSVPAGMTAYRLGLYGLEGGHSGVDIHLGGANANLLLVELLLPLLQEDGALLAGIKGGDLLNVIPFEAEAVLCLPRQGAERAEARLRDRARGLAQAYERTDPGLRVDWSPCALPEEVMEAEGVLQALQAILETPNGVWCEGEEEDVPLQSDNFGLLTAAEGCISAGYLVRAATEQKVEELVQILIERLGRAPARFQYKEYFPAWAPNYQSFLHPLFVDLYRLHFGVEPRLHVLHAGLETGIFLQSYPHLDVLSIGPTILGAHTPQECCYIPSVARLYDFLVLALRAL